jgi:hypothetical protein
MQIRMVGEKMGYLLWTFSCSHGRRDVSSDRGDKRKSKQCSYIALYACKSMHMRLVDSLGLGFRVHWTSSWQRGGSGSSSDRVDKKISKAVLKHFSICM